jgi:hypothetical protein
VNEAAELPVVMRSGLERRRARVERGTLAVEQPLPLPFAGGTMKDWPPVAAYAVTRARSEAAVAVRSERGDPLVAYQTSGQGRIVVVTCGLGRWTPRWMPWPEWPRLAGGLLDWIGGASNEATLGLAVSSVGGGVRVDADVRETSRWAPAGGASLTVTSPAAETRPLRVEPVAPGRLHAEFGDGGPGVYTVVLSTPHGTQRRLHLRRARAEEDHWGTNPAIDAWRDAGLVANWRADAVARRQDATAPGRRTDRWLVGLSLALFLAGVAVDRYERLRNLLRRR